MAGRSWIHTGSGGWSGSRRFTGLFAKPIVHIQPLWAITSNLDDRVSLVVELQVTGAPGQKPDLSPHVESAFTDVVSKITEVRGYKAIGGPGSAYKYAVTVYYKRLRDSVTLPGLKERFALWLTRAVGQALLLGLYHTCVSHVILISSDHVQPISRESVGWVPCSLAFAGLGGGRCDCATYYDMWAMKDRKKHLCNVLMPPGVAGVETTEDIRPETRARLFKLLAWVCQGYSPELKCYQFLSLARDLSLPPDIMEVSAFFSEVIRMCRCGNDRDQMWNCQVNEEPCRYISLMRRMIAWYEAMPEVQNRDHVRLKASMS